MIYFELLGNSWRQSC